MFENVENVENEKVQKESNDNVRGWQIISNQELGSIQRKLTMIRQKEARVAGDNSKIIIRTFRLVDAIRGDFLSNEQKDFIFSKRVNSELVMEVNPGEFIYAQLRKGQRAAIYSPYHNQCQSCSFTAQRGDAIVIGHAHLRPYRYRKKMTQIYEQYLWFLDFICNSANKFKNAQIALALDSRMEEIPEKITIKDIEDEALKRGIKVLPVYIRQAEEKGQDLFCTTVVRRKGVYISLFRDYRDRENEGIRYLKIPWLHSVSEKEKTDFSGSSPLEAASSSPAGWEMGVYFFRRYLLRSTMMSDSFISDGLSSSSKRNSILWISSIASALSNRGLNMIIPGCDPKGYKIRLPKSKSLVIITAFSWMAVLMTVPLVAEDLPNSWMDVTVKPESLSSFRVLPNTHSSRRNRISTRGLHLFKEMYFFILHQLVSVSDAGVDIGECNLGEVIFAGNLFWFYPGGQEVKYLPNHYSMAFYAGFTVADMGVYGDAIEQAFHNRTNTIDTAKSQDYLRLLSGFALILSARVVDFVMENHHDRHMQESGESRKYYEDKTKALLKSYKAITNWRDGQTRNNNPDVSIPRVEGGEIEPPSFSSGYIKASSSLGSSIHPEEEGRDKKFKVLIVEDSKNLLEIVNKILKSKAGSSPLENALSSTEGEREKRLLSTFRVDSISSPMLQPPQDVIQNILHLLKDSSIKQKIKDLFGQGDVIFPGESFTITKNKRIGIEDQIIYLTRMTRFTGLLLFSEGEICGDRNIEVLGEPGLPKSLNRDFLVIEGNRKITFKEYAGEYIRSRVFPEFKFEYSMGSELNGKIAVEQGGFITKDVITGRLKIYDKSHKTIVIKDGIILKLSCISTIPCRAHIPRDEEVHLRYHTHPNNAPVRASPQDLLSIAYDFKQSGKYIPEIIINPDRKARIYILKDVPPIKEWEKSGYYPKEEETARYFHIVELEFSGDGDNSRWEESGDKAGSPLEENLFLTARGIKLIFQASSGANRPVHLCDIANKGLIRGRPFRVFAALSLFFITLLSPVFAAIDSPQSKSHLSVSFNPPFCKIKISGQVSEEVREYITHKCKSVSEATGYLRKFYANFIVRLKEGCLSVVILDDGSHDEQIAKVRRRKSDEIADLISYSPWSAMNALQNAPCDKYAEGHISLWRLLMKYPDSVVTLLDEDFSRMADFIIYKCINEDNPWEGTVHTAGLIVILNKHNVSHANALIKELGKLPREDSLRYLKALKEKIRDNSKYSNTKRIEKTVRRMLKDAGSSPLGGASSSPALGKYGTTVRSIIFRTFLALSTIAGLQGDARSGKKPLSRHQELGLANEAFEKARKYNEYYWMIPGKRKKLDKILGGNLTQILQDNKFEIHYLLLTIYMVGLEKFEDMFNLLSDLAGGNEKAVSLLRNEARSFTTIIGQLHRLDMELEQFKRHIYIIRDFVRKDRFENNFTAEWFLEIVRGFYHARFYFGINLNQINFEVALNAFSDSVGKKIVLYKLLRQDRDIFDTVLALLQMRSEEFRKVYREVEAILPDGAFKNALIAVSGMGVEEFKIWAEYLGEDEIKKLFEVNSYAFGNVFSHLHMIGQKRFKELIVLRGKDEFVKDLVRNPVAIEKILEHISFDIEEGRMEAIIKEIREEYPFLFDIKVMLNQQPSNEAQAILNALPPSLYPILNPQEDSIKSKNKAEKMLRVSALAILAMFQETFSFLTHEDFMKLIGKFLLYPHFSNSVVSNLRRIITADYHMNMNKNLIENMDSDEFIGIVGHEVTHNFLPYEINRVIDEFAAEVGTFVIHHLRKHNDALQKTLWNLDLKVYAGNRNNPLDSTVTSRIATKARAQLLWIIKTFQESDSGLDWNEFYKLAVHLGREQPELTFRNFIIKLMARYLQETGRSNITWEGMDLLLPPESGVDMLTPEELNLIINDNRKEKGSSPLESNSEIIGVENWRQSPVSLRKDFDLSQGEAVGASSSPLKSIFVSIIRNRAPPSRLLKFIISASFAIVFMLFPSSTFYIFSAKYHLSISQVYASEEPENSRETVRPEVLERHVRLAQKEILKIFSNVIVKKSAGRISEIYVLPGEVNFTAFNKTDIRKTTNNLKAQAKKEADDLAKSFKNAERSLEAEMFILAWGGRELFDVVMDIIIFTDGKLDPSMREVPAYSFYAGANNLMKVLKVSIEFLESLSPRITYIKNEERKFPNWSKITSIRDIAATSRKISNNLYVIAHREDYEAIFPNPSDQLSSVQRKEIELIADRCLQVSFEFMAESLKNNNVSKGTTKEAYFESSLPAFCPKVKVVSRIEGISSEKAFLAIEAAVIRKIENALSKNKTGSSPLEAATSSPAGERKVMAGYFDIRLKNSPELSMGMPLYEGFNSRISLSLVTICVAFASTSVSMMKLSSLSLQMLSFVRGFTVIAFRPMTVINSSISRGLTFNSFVRKTSLISSNSLSETIRVNLPSLKAWYIAELAGLLSRQEMKILVSMTAFISCIYLFPGQLANPGYFFFGGYAFYLAAYIVYRVIQSSGPGSLFKPLHQLYLFLNRKFTDKLFYINSGSNRHFIPLFAIKNTILLLIISQEFMAKAASSSPLEEDRLRELLSGIINCINNPAQAGLSVSVDSLCEFLLRLPLEALRKIRFYDCLFQALRDAAIKTDLGVLKKEALKHIANAIAVKLKSLPSNSNDYQRYVEVLFYLTLPYVKKALKMGQIRPFEDLLREFYPILLLSIAGYDERKGGNFPAYYSYKLKNDANKRRFDTFAYARGSGKEDSNEESYLETAAAEKAEKEYASRAREERAARVLRREIDGIADKLWREVKGGIRIVLALGEEEVSSFDSELLEKCYKVINKFRGKGKDRRLNWPRLTKKFPVLKDSYRAGSYFFRQLYILFIFCGIYKDKTAKNQSAIAKRLGLSSQVVDIYMRRDIWPLLMSKMSGTGIGLARKQLTARYEERWDKIQRIKDYLEGKSGDANLLLVRNVCGGVIVFCGLTICLPAFIAKTNKKVEAGIIRYAGQEYGERVFMITVYTADSKKEKLGHCLCRNVNKKLRSLSGDRYVGLTVDIKGTKQAYGDFFKKLREGIIEELPTEAIDIRTYKRGDFYLRGLDSASLNLSCHKYSLTIIGANETSVIVEFASLERPGHKEWKMFSGQGIDKSVACRWGMAAIKEGENRLIFCPKNNKQQAANFTLTPAYWKSRELRKETSPPAGEAGSPLEENMSGRFSFDFDEWRFRETHASSAVENKETFLAFSRLAEIWQIRMNFGAAVNTRAESVLSGPAEMEKGILAKKIAIVPTAGSSLIIKILGLEKSFPPCSCFFRTGILKSSEVSSNVTNNGPPYAILELELFLLIILK